VPPLRSRSLLSRNATPLGPGWKRPGLVAFVLKGSVPAPFIGGMATDTAKLIRSALKTLGYGPRDISIRARTTGSVDVTIKRADVALDVIEPVVHQFEHVRRCESSGEILTGGNTFVTIDYSDSALIDATRLVAAHRSQGRTVFGALHIGADAADADTVHVWEDHSHVGQYGEPYVSARLARLLARRGELGCLEQLDWLSPVDDAALDAKLEAQAVDPNFSIC